MLMFVSSYFIGYLLGIFLGPVALLLIIASILYSALASALTTLADRYAAHRAKHPPNPAHIRRNTRIFWITWASLIALDVLYVNLTR
jgi:hypothetical protein